MSTSRNTSGPAKRRVQFLDEARGLCAVLMVVYHGAYDLVYLFGVNIPAFHAPVLSFLQPLVAGIFIAISGVACRYSRSNLKRGGIALGCGLLLSLGTWLLMPEQIIAFGILHLLGSCMLLYGLAHRALDRIPPLWGILTSGALFAVLYGVPAGRVGLGGFSVPVPRAWYGTEFLFPFGLYSENFRSSDYFPLVPWLFLFLAGSYLGKWFIQGKMPAMFYRSHVPPLAAAGRKALWIYLLHQPVVYGVLWAVFQLLSLLGLRV